MARLGFTQGTEELQEQAWLDRNCQCHIPNAGKREQVM